MARRRNTRRRNPIKSTGMLVINPRRRNTRRKNTSRRRNTRRRNTRRRNSNGQYKRIAGSYYSGARRRNTRRRNTRRRNTRRRNTARRRNTRRRNTRRRNSVLAYRRANGRRRNTRRRNTRRRNTRRRNTRRRNTRKGFLAKIPVVGPTLDKALSFLMPAGLGAIAVEPTLMAAKFLGPMMPNLPSSVFYVGTGLLLAGFVASTKFLGAKFHKDLALAIASATGGVAYYKWRTGSDIPVAAEAGALEIHGVHGWADGLAYAVQPYSGYGAFIHGR
jgi:hypothetical protein